MIYIYSSIILLTLLGGCSWWNNAEDVTACNTQHTPSCVESEFPDAFAEVIELSKDINDDQNHDDEYFADQEERRESVAQAIKRQEPSVGLDEKRITQKQKGRRAFKQRRTKKKVVIREENSEKSIADLVIVEQAPNSVAPAPCYTYASTQNASSDDSKSNSNKAPQSATLSIKNDIDTHMLTVKHWSGTYFPTKLTVEINGQMTKIVENGILLQQQQLAIPMTDSTLCVTYNYEFMQGMRKDEKSLTYKVADNTDALKMSFNWDTPWHVIFDHAEPLQT